VKFDFSLTLMDSRTRAVLDVLSRNVPYDDLKGSLASDVQEKIDFVVKSLRIPTQWISQAKVTAKKNIY
jgi:hypothetical protein